MSDKTSNDLNECSICLEPLNDNISILEKCLHKYHESCINEWFSKKKETKCPTCDINSVSRLFLDDNKTNFIIRNYGSRLIKYKIKKQEIPRPTLINPNSLNTEYNKIIEDKDINDQVLMTPILESQQKKQEVTPEKVQIRSTQLCSCILS